MQLVSCPNSSGINRNHQNNVLTIAMDITDIISAIVITIPMSIIDVSNVSNALCYCDFVGLVPP
jgi:hypothetical protein